MTDEKKRSFVNSQGDSHKYDNLHEHPDDHHEFFDASTNHHTHTGLIPVGMTQADLEFLRSGNATIGLKVTSASPGALGLLGFGLTTFLLNLANAGVFPLNSMILAMGICYGGIAQIIAGIMEFTRGNLFGFIAFVSYGLFWWSLCFTIMFPSMGYLKMPTADGMACYLFIWGVFSFIMLVGTFLKRLPVMLSWVFFTVVILFALLAAAKWTESDAVEKAAGIEGVICGLSAIYLAAAEILNELAGRQVFYVGLRPPLAVPKK
jgi:succinate-acetate transporter protein